MFDIEAIKNSIISLLTDRDFYITVISITILMFLSAFFAAIESSFFSLDRLKIKRLKENGNKLAGLIYKIRSRPKELVITFLIGNELVNITASAIMSNFIIKKFGEEYIFIGVFIMTILILTFGEITPKTLGSYYPEKYAFFAIRPFLIFYQAVTPFRWLFLKFSEYILRKLGLEIPVESHKISKEDVLSILNVHIENNLFSEDEIELIENTLNLSNIDVKEAMIPRKNIFALPRGITVFQALEIIEKKNIRYSRIPVYEGTLDNIIGVLHLKDIIVAKFENKNEVIDKFLKEPLLVPEFISLLKLLEKFNETRKHLAIVVDELGTVVGLITYQDIIDYLLEPYGNENQKENEEEEGIVEVEKDKKWIAEGKTDIEDLVEKFNLKLPEEYDFDTVSGFASYKLATVPQENKEFIHDNYKFKILEVENNRVLTIEIEKIEKEENKEKEEESKE